MHSVQTGLSNKSVGFSREQLATIIVQVCRPLFLRMPYQDPAHIAQVKDALCMELIMQSATSIDFAQLQIDAIIRDWFHTMRRKAAARLRVMIAGLKLKENGVAAIIARDPKWMMRLCTQLLRTLGLHVTSQTMDFVKTQLAQFL